MYRFKKYKGSFVNNIREGHGIATYTNDDTIEGNFKAGQPHGVMVISFVPKPEEEHGRVRLAKYEHGTRIDWIKIRHQKPKVKKQSEIESMRKSLMV